MNSAMLVLAIAFYGALAIVATASYVFSCLGIYTIAKRRGIDKPWLAWLPIGNVWIIGSISDQYQQQMKNKQTKRRKILLGMDIVGYVLSIVFTVVMIVLVIFMSTTMVSAMYDNYAYDDYAYNDYYYESYGSDSDLVVAGVVLIISLGSMAASNILLALAIVESVFLYLSYYDVFVSCEPDKALFYLIFSVVVPFALPIALFICRNKDQGMLTDSCVEQPCELPETAAAEAETEILSDEV